MIKQYQRPVTINIYLNKCLNLLYHFFLTFVMCSERCGMYAGIKSALQAELKEITIISIN